MSAWIFQANPKTFAIEEFLASDPKEFLYRVSRYSEQLKVGDTVYLWKSKGSREGKRGIVAKCSINSGILSCNDISESGKFWVNLADRDAIENKVQLRVILVLSPSNFIDSREIALDNDLKDLIILKFAAGSNFPVHDHESDAIERIISKRILA